MAKTDYWPFDFTERDKGVTKFAPVTVTINRPIVGGDKSKSPGKFFGWTFKEDTTDAGEYQGKPQTGAIWSPPQTWNEGTQSYDPYTGPKFKAGDVVTVRLAISEKGEDVRRRVVKIEPASGAAPEPATPETAKEAYRPPVDTRNASIVSQVAFKALTDMLIANKVPMWERGPLLENGNDGPPILTRHGVEWYVMYDAFRQGQAPDWNAAPEVLDAEKDDTEADSLPFKGPRTEA